MTALSVDAQQSRASTAPLYWMALGAFAIGTESFMVAAILPAIAEDLDVRIEVAGQLVTAFALTYAVSSPLLTVLTGSIGRRRLLIGCMMMFAGANLLAALSTSYVALLMARVLLAAAAGLYVPNANAIASALVSPDRRGRALAIVTGGLSLAVALGVPMGALIGGHFGWRMTFAGVSLLSAIALIGLMVGVPKGIGAGYVPANLRDRMTAVARPGVLPALLVTMLWAAGGFTVYTYLAVVLSQATELRATGIGLALFGWGASAFIGLIAGGRLTDRVGASRVIAFSLPVVAAALASLSVSSRLFSPDMAVVPMLVAIVVWGASAWGFFPAQQARLIGITGAASAPVILSLNASSQYAGFAIGAASGGFVLAHGSSPDLGLTGGLCVLGAALLNAMGRKTPGERRGARRGRD